METYLNILNQEKIEEFYSDKPIEGNIAKFIKDDVEIQHKVLEGVDLIHAYMDQEYYASKNRRIEQLRSLDLPELVTRIYESIALIVRPELFTAVTAKVAARLGFSDKAEAITTTAELIAVLCATDVFDITKANRQASLMLVSNIELPQEILEHMNRVQYLPPMVCEPLSLSNNSDSGYLTFRDSVMLGKGNHHNGNLCLDVLNLMNKVPLSLDLEFLDTLEEIPTFDLDTQEKVEMWQAFKNQSTEIYRLMVRQGNKFYLTHKVDKRGRIYAQGYHITTQGTAFKKASLELANEELVNGVPDEHRL